MIFKYRIFSEQLQLVPTSFSFLIPAYSLGGGEQNGRLDLQSGRPLKKAG